MIRFSPLAGDILSSPLLPGAAAAAAAAAAGAAIPGTRLESMSFLITSTTGKNGR